MVADVQANLLGLLGDSQPYGVLDGQQDQSGHYEGPRPGDTNADQLVPDLLNAADASPRPP